MATAMAMPTPTQRSPYRQLAMSLDPVVFARAAGIEPDPWQIAVLRSEAPRFLLNCARQAGKSTVVGIKAGWTATYTPGALVLLLAAAQRQSGELFRKTLQTMRDAGWPVKTKTLGATSCELMNGSRIVALPATEGTIRGFSNVTLLLIDEAARVPDETYASVRPMLAVSGGRLGALSTPFGKRGWWWEAWENINGTDGEWPWFRTKITADQCPRIPPAFLAEEQHENGIWWFSQEYMGTFMDAQTAAFREEDIRAAFTDAPLLEGIDTYLGGETRTEGMRDDLGRWDFTFGLDGEDV